MSSQLDPVGVRYRIRFGVRVRIQRTNERTDGTDRTNYGCRSGTGSRRTGAYEGLNSRALINRQRQAASELPTTTTSAALAATKETP